MLRSYYVLSNLRRSQDQEQAEVEELHKSAIIVCALSHGLLAPDPKEAARRSALVTDDANDHHDLRHQELRHDEEGARLARQGRRRLRVPRLQGRRHRQGAARSAGQKVGWETLLNRAGTTFRKLPDKDKEGLTAAKAITLMLEQPSMIKRPVLELGDGKLLVGFKPEDYKAMR